MCGYVLACVFISQFLCVLMCVSVGGCTYPGDSRLQVGTGAGLLCVCAFVLARACVCLYGWSACECVRMSRCICELVRVCMCAFIFL